MLPPRQAKENMKINVIVVFRSIGLKKFHGCNMMRGVRGAQFIATFTIIPNNNRGLVRRICS
jgi:hypothetical protein